jgi:hypothetical protein
VVDGKLPHGRSVCVDRMRHGADGLVQPVTMTDAGVPATMAPATPAMPPPRPAAGQRQP